MARAFKLIISNEAQKQLKALESDQRKLKKVRKCLAWIETNPKHPSLNSHKYSARKSAHGADLIESYVENKTPAAWRVFWSYGPEPGQITIITITEHP